MTSVHRGEAGLKEIQTPSPYGFLKTFLLWIKMYTEVETTAVNTHVPSSHLLANLVSTASILSLLPSSLPPL